MPLSVIALGSLGVALPWLSIVTIIVVIGMVILSVYAGRRFAAKETLSEAPGPLRLHLAVRS